MAKDKDRETVEDKDATRSSLLVRRTRKKQQQRQLANSNSCPN